MNCSQTQNWLYEADAGEARPAEVVAHMQACAECRALAERIGQLESDWRALPLLAPCEAAKQRVLAEVMLQPAHELVSLAAANRPGGGRRRWSHRLSLPSWALAGAVLIAVGIGLYAWLPSSEAQAAPDAFDRLLDMNVALAEAEPGDRAKLYSDAQAALTAAATSTELSPEESEMAKTLLDNANSLAKNGDPVADAERLSKLADRLFDRLKSAEKDKKLPKLAKAAKQFAKADRAALSSWENAEKLAATDPAQEQRLSDLVSRNMKRQEAFEALLLATPKSEKETLQKALDHAGHHGKGHNKHPHHKRHSQPNEATA